MLWLREPNRWAVLVLLLATSCVALLGHGCGGGRALRVEPSAESRAVAFLLNEVPAWHRENACFSCHNNGDAARALLAAGRNGFHIPDAALADTREWLMKPAGWAENKGDPGFSDLRLADIQFGAALLALDAPSRAAGSSSAINAAALRVAAGQDPDGSWQIEPQNPIGSPATYGTALATFMAWRFLREAGSTETSGAVAKADDWLGRLRPDSVPSAAIILLFAAEDGALQSSPRVPESVTYLIQAQTSDGGWGPYPNSPAEAFDTALALLAFERMNGISGMRGPIRKGRAFLKAWQQPDGSWPPSTRPPGGASYAQRMSTTGWATLALLATRSIARDN